MKPTGKGLTTPRAYAKAVKRRQKAKKLLDGIERDIPVLTTVAAMEVGRAGKVLNAGLGYTFGRALAREAAMKRHKISLKTLAEISGRPKVAELVVRRLIVTDPKFAAKIKAWGEKGPKMNKRQREAFVKDNRYRDIENIDYGK